MSLKPQGLYLLACLASFSLCHSSYADCQINDLSFNITVESMLAQVATVTTTAQAAAHNIVNGCADSEILSVQYQIGQLANISSPSIDIAGRRFYKIGFLQADNSGNSALDYLTQHAYVAFSIQAADRTIAVNSLPDNPIDLVQFNATSNGNQQPSLMVGLSDIQFYFDALPTNDAIVQQLATQQMRLQVGQLNLQLQQKDQLETTLLNATSALWMDIHGIEFQRATCFVKEQNVRLDAVVVTAIKAREAAGNAKAFDVDLQCDGYLNQRELHLTWLDNNDRNNLNQQGYLSSVQGSSYSNVGVQITDETHHPIQIGKEYIFEPALSGQQITKSYRARYYLPEGQPTVGIVNAQATLQIQYP